MAPAVGGIVGSRDLRAAWERRQQAAELAAAVAQLPTHAGSKPALFAAQLLPVVAALHQAAMAGSRGHDFLSSSSDSECSSNAEEEVHQQEGLVNGSPVTDQPLYHQQESWVSEAAAHLGRLQHIDAQGSANACLLLHMLLRLLADQLPSSTWEEGTAGGRGCLLQVTHSGVSA
jgi:hypothetical protein